MADQRFTKARRLLTPSQFKAVFDGAAFKVSTRELLILARPNALPGARLGLVIGKRHAKLAVSRNRIKRAARETFRQRQAELAGLDGIVLARGGIDQLDQRELQLQLSQLWRQLQRKASKRLAEQASC